MDLISRQAAIDSMTEIIWHYPNELYPGLNAYETARGLAEMGLLSVPSAQPDVPDINVGNCPYCHEDSDGFVFPIEKNGHACVWHDVDGWVISLKAKGWSGSCRIKFCPMCGRELKHG